MNITATQITNIKTVCSIACLGEHKKTMKLRITSLLWGTTRDWVFPAQRASYAENLCYEIIVW